MPIQQQMTDTQLIDALEKVFEKRFAIYFGKPDYECVGWTVRITNTGSLHAQQVHQGEVNGQTFREALQSALTEDK